MNVNENTYYILNESDYLQQFNHENILNYHKTDYNNYLKMYILLRDPVSRLWSSFWMRYNRGGPLSKPKRWQAFKEILESKNMSVKNVASNEIYKYNDSIDEYINVKMNYGCYSYDTCMTQITNQMKNIITNYNLNNPNNIKFIKYYDNLINIMKQLKIDNFSSNFGNNINNGFNIKYFKYIISQFYIISSAIEREPDSYVFGNKLEFDQFTQGIYFPMIISYYYYLCLNKNRIFFSNSNSNNNQFCNFKILQTEQITDDNIDKTIYYLRLWMMDANYYSYYYYDNRDDTTAAGNNNINDNFESLHNIKIDSIENANDLKDSISHAGHYSTGIMPDDVKNDMAALYYHWNQFLYQFLQINSHLLLKPIQSYFKEWEKST